MKRWTAAVFLLFLMLLMFISVCLKAESFLIRCQNPALPQESRHTLNILRHLYPSSSCQELGQRLAQQQSLDLSQQNIRDLSLIRSFRQLRQLRLQNNQIRDISPLRHMSELRSLNLSSNQISDLSPLSHLNLLQELRLANNQISSLAKLKELSSLQLLDVSQNQLQNLAGIRHMRQLTALSFSHNQVRDPSAIMGLKELKILKGRNNNLADLSPFRALVHLQSLDLSGNSIRKLLSLARMTDLKRLNMSDNQIQDLSPLSFLKGLQSLTIAGNQIRDLSPLRVLQKLLTLDLGNNQIRSVRPLLRLKSLRQLSLSGNPLQDAALLRSMHRVKLIRKDLPHNKETTQVSKEPQNIGSRSLPESLSEAEFSQRINARLLRGVIIIGFLFLFLTLILLAWWQLFRKFGIPGWHALIPILNLISYLRLCGCPRWWAFFLLLPLPVLLTILFLPAQVFLIAKALLMSVLAAAIIMLISYHRLRQRYGLSLLFLFGLTLLPPLFFLILAFSHHSDSFEDL